MARNMLVRAHGLLYLAVVKTFGQILESAEELSIEDQETLVSILRRWLADERRAELIQAVREARQEYKAGRCRPASPAEITKKIRA